MNTPSLIIRNYRSDDFNHYLRLFLATGKIDPTGPYIGPLSLSESLNRPNYSPEKDLFLAKKKEEVIGFCSVIPELGIGRVLLEFLVHPRHRRKNIATRLLRYALKRAQEYGAVVAQADIRETDLAARGLLSGLGFRYVRRFLELDMALQKGLLVVSEPPLIRRSLKGGEEHQLAEIQNRFFAGSWRFNPNTTEDITYRLHLGGLTGGRHPVL